MEKVYIMIFGIANIVAGGPIYDWNKINYLEERGWKVIVFPTDSGEIYIRGLEKYNGKEYGFIHRCPFVFSKKQRDIFLDEMQKEVPMCDNIVIETGTDDTALWGELFANRLKAKHIVMFLDEKNERVNKYSSGFYEFKYKKKELTSISEKSLMHIFSPYFPIYHPERYVWRAWCSNSVADIESPMIDAIPKADYVIASIGRLEKDFVPTIINGICEFAEMVSNKQIGVCLLGGADDKVVKKMRDKLEAHKNISLYISGYIWPIPKKAFKKMDVFISGAGAATVSANMGVATVRMDVLEGVPVGLIADPSVNRLVINEGASHEVVDYLKQVLLEKNMPHIENCKSVEDTWKQICTDFDIHMDFIEQSRSNENAYYSVEKMWNGKWMSVISKCLLFIFTYEQFEKMRKIYCKVRSGLLGNGKAKGTFRKCNW